MASYTKLIFNRDAFISVVIKYFDEALKEAINASFKHKYYDGKQEVYQVFQGTQIDLTFNDIKAWILEYGSGTYTDESNPDFQSYKNSQYWNVYRNSLEIVKRGSKISQPVLDWENGDGYSSKTGADPAGGSLPGALGLGVKPNPFLADLLNDTYLQFVKNIEVNAISQIESSQLEYYTLQKVR